MARPHPPPHCEGEARRGLSSAPANRPLGILQLLLAPPVAALLDQFTRDGEIGGGGSPGIFRFAEEEAGAVEVNVGYVEFHGAALGDFPGLVQVVLRALGAGAFAFEKPQPGAGEEAAREVMLRPARRRPSTACWRGAWQGSSDEPSRIAA